WPMQGIEVWPNPEAAGSYDGEVQYLTTWLQLRMAYLDSLFNNRTATATTLSLSAASLAHGASATFSVQVTAGSSPTGMVTFLSNGIPLGSATLGAGGIATFSTTALPTGVDSIIAAYNGDANNALSASSPSSITVAAPLSATVLSLSGPVTINGATQAFTASVIPGQSGSVPTGTVTFAIDNGAGTTAPLAANQTASASLNFATSGTHTITATYSGDAGNAASSAVISVAVSIPASISVSGTNVSIQAGATTGNTSTVTVTPAGGFIGSVTLSAVITNTPAGATEMPVLSFTSANPVGVTGGPASATLAVTSFGPVLADASPARKGIIGAGGLALAGVLLLGFRVRRRKWTTLLGAVILMLALTGGLAGCGDKLQAAKTGQITNPGTSPGAYVITITATSGSLTTQSTINLQVQ
ncbi:MAG: Ig-like domain-containing protein, partial [Terracidiphilus sp.]